MVHPLISPVKLQKHENKKSRIISASKCVSVVIQRQWWRLSHAWQSQRPEEAQIDATAEAAGRARDRDRGRGEAMLSGRTKHTIGLHSSELLPHARNGPRRSTIPFTWPNPNLELSVSPVFLFHSSPRPRPPSQFSFIVPVGCSRPLSLYSHRTAPVVMSFHLVWRSAEISPRPTSRSFESVVLCWKLLPPWRLLRRRLLSFRRRVSTAHVHHIDRGATKGLGFRVLRNWEPASSTETFDVRHHGNKEHTSYEVPQNQSKSPKKLNNKKVI